LEERTHGRSQQQELATLGEDGVRRLVDDFVAAWEAGDVEALTALLSEDARFTMPPLPAWFDGRDMVARFLSERLFATPWRLEPRTVNGQPGFLCHQQVGGAWIRGAVNVLAVRDGRISWIAGFVDPDVVDNFSTDR
jgi:RNA polymerase sigma-70 factor (ECF subfamily)